VANEKYDNLMVLMTSGKLNWASDAIVALLMTGVTYNVSHTTIAEAGGTRKAMVPVPRRSVGPTGSLLGGAVSFSNMPKDTDFQMLIAKDMGPGTVPSLLAFYDSDGDDNPLRLANNGTLIVRPEQLLPAEDTGQGTWVTI
jgi:hypothetical protein